MVMNSQIRWQHVVSWISILKPSLSRLLWIAGRLWKSHHFHSCRTISIEEIPRVTGSVQAIA